MNVWILTIGEPLPKKGEQVRLYRSGILAETLVARGHKVTWFTSNFDHFTKTFHDEKEIGGTAKIILLPGTGYKRNISLARFKDHVKVAQSFREVASKQEEPDIILASVPIMELALEALDYAEPRGIPVVLDARDMWPDMFDEALPRAFKPIAKVLFSKLRKETREGFSRATAILGHTESFVEWGLSYANRERTDQDRAFYFGYPDNRVDSDEQTCADAFWDGLQVPADGKFRVIFLGSLTQQFDFNPILEAAKNLSEVEFVICGSGTLFDSLSLAAQGLENVKLPGWVDFPKLDALMRRSNVGLMPYVPKHAFESSIPNKAIEYMSGALPILWTMDKGELADLIRLKRIGATYDPKSAQTFMESLKGMMNDPIGVKTMGLNGRKLFEERFTAERVYAEFSAHLENLARPR